MIRHIDVTREAESNLNGRAKGCVMTLHSPEAVGQIFSNAASTRNGGAVNRGYDYGVAPETRRSPP